MAWPPNVSAGQALLASQFNGVISALKVWGGNVSAGGFQIGDLLNAGLHSVNSSWQEFQITANAGVSQVNDWLELDYNTRASAGAADNWLSVLTIAVSNGALAFQVPVTFAGAVTFSSTAAGVLTAANNLSDLSSVATARTNLGLAASATIDTTNASNITSGVLGIAEGGTGQTTAAAALTALGGASLAAANVFAGAQTFNGAVTFAAALSRPSRTITANATALNSDFMVVMNGAGITLLLPAVPAAGQTMFLVNANAAGAFVDGNGNPFWANGAVLPSPVAFSAGGSVILQWDGATWRDMLPPSSGGGTNPATFGPVAHQFINSYNASTGAFTAAQPAAADITGLAASATTDTTNASNITSGVLGIAEGGTGQTSAAAALTALGGASLSANNTLAGVQTCNGQITTGTNIPVTFRSGNASWDEFRIIVPTAGTLASDQFSFQYNTRTSVGGSDSWSTAFFFLQGANYLQSNLKLSVGVSARQQLSVGAGLDIFTGGTATTAQPSIRSSASAGTLFMGAAGTNPLNLQWDAGSGGVVFGNGAGASSGASVSSAGLITCPSLTITTPANLSYGTSGSNWQTWTPTLTCSGSMTISGTTVSVAQYIRVGPFVYFMIIFSGTLGGTVSNTVNASLPVALVGSATNCYCNVATSTTAATASLCTIGTTLQFQLNTQANYPSGAVTCSATGFYRVAN